MPVPLRNLNWSVCPHLVEKVNQICFCKNNFGNSCQYQWWKFNIIWVRNIYSRIVDVLWKFLWYSLCITMFAATSVWDNSQAMVMGSCLLGEDGGNQWQEECACVARLGQRRKCRCVFLCVPLQAYMCVVQNYVCSEIENLKCDMNILSILPWKYLKIPLKRPHLGLLPDNTVQCPWWQANWERK